MRPRYLSTLVTIILRFREELTKLCERFPGEYWRNLEHQPLESSYPTEFIRALTDAGYLGVLIPEVYGGSGLPLGGGPSFWRQSTRVAAAPQPDTPRCIPWEPFCATEARNKSKNTCQRSLAVRFDFKLSVSWNRLLGQIRLESRPKQTRPRAGMLSTAKKSGRAGRCIPTSCCCWRVRHP